MQSHISLFQGQRPAFVLVVALSFLTNLLMLTVPIFMLQLFSRVLGSGSIETLFMLVLIAGVALVTYMLLEMLRQRALLRIAMRLEADLGDKVMNHLLRRSGNAKDRSAQGLRDLQELRGYISGHAFTGLLDTPWAAIFLVVIFLLHPLLGVIATLGALFLIVVGAIGEIITRRPRRFMRDASQAVGNSAELAVRSAESMNAMGGVKSYLTEWRKSNNVVLAASAVASDRISTLSSIAKATRMGLQITMLSVGVTLVLDNQISTGAMIACSILMGRMVAPFEQFLTNWRAFESARRAADNLKAMLLDADREDGLIDLPEPAGALTVQNVFYLAGRRTQPVLNNINFHLEPGETLGVLGPSGSGKSALCRLLAGVDQPTRGQVCLDGGSLANWPPHQLGRYFGYLPQQPELHTGTIADNICGFDPDANPGDIVAAARAAGVHDMILTLSEGYNTLIDAYMSVGHRHLIALARVFYGERRVFVFDEPTAHFDGAAEQSFAAALNDAKSRGCTIVLVTHSMKILTGMDKLLVLNNGSQTAFGATAEVISRLSNNDRNTRPQLSVVNAGGKADGQDRNPGLEKPKNDGPS